MTPVASGLIIFPKEMCFGFVRCERAGGAAGQSRWCVGCVERRSAEDEERGGALASNAEEALRGPHRELPRTGSLQFDGPLQGASLVVDTI